MLQSGLKLTGYYVGEELQKEYTTKTGEKVQNKRIAINTGGLYNKIIVVPKSFKVEPDKEGMISLDVETQASHWENGKPTRIQVDFYVPKAG
jgi:hypothetical protein